MRSIRLLASVLLLALAAGTVYALPPSRQGPVDTRTGRYRTTGFKAPVIPEAVRTYRRATPLNGKYPLDPKRAPARAGVRPLAVDTKTQSVVRPLVLLIDFADRPASSSPAISNPAAFVNLFFGSGASDLSVGNYWNEVSYGKFTIQRPSAASSNPDVVGWLRAGGTPPTGFPTTITSSVDIAGVNVTNVRQILADAIASLSAQGFDFTPYVRPSDSTFNAVILVQPGAGQEDSGYAGDTYSHTAPISPIVTAAGTIVDYTIVPAKQVYTDPSPPNPITGADSNLADDPLVGIGVIVHEMGHLLGLPDLYPTAPFGQVGGSFSGVGVFDLMGYGLWGSNFLDRADNPAHLSAWSKAFLGWLVPTLRTGTAGLTLPPVEGFPQADKVYSNTVADPGQYFLVENRQVASSSASWLFDKFLVAPTGGGAGILIWQIDNEVITANPTGVNSDNAFRGVYIKEADGVYHMALPIPAGNPNDQAAYFGIESDYFNQNPLNGQPRVFSRTLPSATVNSTPIVSAFHPFDFGTEVTMAEFLQRGTGEMDYLLSIIPGGGGAAAAWKTFNVASTTGTYPTPMRSNDILSLSFDSGNNIWMGSLNQGIFRFLGTDFTILNTLQGLPSGASPLDPVARIQAMVFESATGSMWVGTDRGLYKMRDSGSGFRVLDTTRTGGLGLPGNRVPQALDPGLNVIRSLAIRGGFLSGSQPIDIKYAATPLGLLRVDDLNNDQASDDIVSVILAGDVTSVAVDDNGTPTAADDVVWVGFSNGTFTRSLLPNEGGNINNDPLRDADFLSPRYTLSGLPRVTSLAVDKKGILWIGTDGRGVQAFDLGETLNPPAPNLRDPYDFNGDGAAQTEAYLNFNVVADDNNVNGSNNITGIGFESSALPEPVAWISQRSQPVSIPDNLYVGGASRFDANLQNDNTTVNRDERLKVYSPIPPLDVATTFGRSSSVAAVAGDAAGNVWFATTQPAVSSFPTDVANGVVRFGNA
ncbi:MAG TPA: M6 family metalloprotease domain-containing protein, partial [Candidatus Deferrimicrobiaceae bacterium]